MGVMPADELIRAVQALPAAPWGIGVSGGADSVALLHLMHHHRPDVVLHVVHLDHETRGEASAADAAFVRGLADRWGLRCTVARLSEIERCLTAVPSNASARYRAARHKLFRDVIEEHGLHGVLLAHHADDQAETVLHRLLRGAKAPYLAGMAQQGRVRGIFIVRPLLEVPRRVLRDYLVSVNQGWREDASNASPEYLRNRLRRLLEAHPPLRDALLDAHDAMGGLRDWVKGAAPALEERFFVRDLQGQPEILAAEAVRRWLVKRGVSPDEIHSGTVAGVIEMAIDSASPPRRSLPGGIRIRRSRGVIYTEPGA